MAEENKPVEPVKPYVFDEKAFEAKVETIRVSANAAEGKPNYNPHIFLKHNGYSDAIRAYKQGNRSKELFDSVMSLPNEVPCIDPDWQPPVAYKPELPKALRPPVGK